MLPRSILEVKGEILASLGERGADVDGPELDAYATCVARLRDAQARIEAEQLIVPDKHDQPVVHPAFAVERQCMDELRKWGDRFRPGKSKTVGGSKRGFALS